MAAGPTESPELIERARAGDALARQDLLARHRPRLRAMVEARLDRRVAARVDPSDVVQDALAEAQRTLDDYLRDLPLPLYPWLRRLAWERLAQLHRRHLEASKRSLRREDPGAPGLPHESAMLLADRLVASDTSPSQHAVRQEIRDHVRATLDGMSPNDREILALRFLEQLSTAEAAAVLGIGEGAVKSRLMRAVLRFRELLEVGPDREEWR